MRRLFEAVQFFPVPDGTRVAPVLNPYDANAHSVRRDGLPGASLAVGELAPGCVSKPHLHPVVSQVTWVLEGAMLVRMKGPGDDQPYELQVSRGQGVLTEPMTFFQLVNPDAIHAARVLYVVSPAYLYLPGVDGYDDAVVFHETWEQLAAERFRARGVNDIETARARRARAMSRIGAADG
jgi:mannose-6-phosphate isomerase-like protein (cupin superfamily)